MKSKDAEKTKAIEMRKNGFSLNEISTSLKISKSSASLWVRSVPLSLKAQSQILEKRELGKIKAKASKFARTTGRLKEAAAFADEIVSSVSDNKNYSRVYCALLYWCEGEKSKNDESLFFTNSDPLLVKTYLRTLRAGFETNEKKFRVCIHLHSYHNSKKQLLFWSQITNIPLAQFIKPYRKQDSGKNVKLGYAGCASVRYHDVRIARQVQAIARAFLKKGP
ncbi:hypothetical protein H7X87_02790 [Acetobacteraceae bacterium]|nr:hypothetical protein [Candidatus Parcubacteria bacterium]